MKSRYNSRVFTILILLTRDETKAFNFLIKGILILDTGVQCILVFVLIFLVLFQSLK